MKNEQPEVGESTPEKKAWVQGKDWYEDIPMPSKVKPITLFHVADDQWQQVWMKAFGIDEEVEVDRFISTAVHPSSFRIRKKNSDSFDLQLTIDTDFKFNTSVFRSDWETQAFNAVSVVDYLRSIGVQFN